MISEEDEKKLRFLYEYMREENGHLSYWHRILLGALQRIRNNRKNDLPATYIASDTIQVYNLWVLKMEEKREKENGQVTI